MMVAIQPGLFGEVLESRGVAGWQVVQESPSRVRVQVVPANGFEEGELERKLLRELELAGATGTEVKIQQVDALVQTAVGKTPLVQGLRLDGEGP